MNNSLGRNVKKSLLEKLTSKSNTFRVSASGRQKTGVGAKDTAGHGGKVVGETEEKEKEKEGERKTAEIQEVWGSVTFVRRVKISGIPLACARTCSTNSKSTS